MSGVREHVRRNHQAYADLVERARREGDDEQRAILLSLAAQFAVRNFCGIYSDWRLEEPLVELAARHEPAGEPAVARAGSWLHVMTRCHAVGGHTRVVDRWIEGSPADEVHSLLLLGQEVPIPDWLRASVASRGGDVIDLRGEALIPKAMELRRIAAGFERVVLHVDMHDIHPLIAFGTPRFERPVIFYNHADHLYWVGVSIADIVADMSALGRAISVGRRGVERSARLPVPLPVPAPPPDRAASREELGLGPDDRLILSSGTPHRFRPFGGFDFVRAMEQILERNPAARMVVLGPDPAEPMWADAAARSGGRITATGLVERARFRAFAAAADLYVDSFPMGSGTALLEVALMGIPILSIRNDHLLTPFDVFDVPDSRIASMPQLVDRATDILGGGRTAALAAAEALREEVVRQHCPAGWRTELDALLHLLPPRHRAPAPFTSVAGVGEREEFLVGLLREGNHRAELSLLDFARLRLASKLFVWRRIRTLSATGPAYVAKLALATLTRHYRALTRLPRRGRRG